MTSTAVVGQHGGRRWFGRRGDLDRYPFPSVAATDPAGRLRAVDELRAWAEEHAEQAIDWYRRDWLVRPGGVSPEAGGIPAGDAGDMAAELSRRLGLVRELVEDVTGFIEAETSDWMAEFRASVGQLHSQTGLTTVVGDPPGGPGQSRSIGALSGSQRNAGT